MAIRSKGRIEIAFGSEGAARSAEAALASEKGFGRARTRIARDRKALAIEIYADDTVAFRAALNGLFRNLQVFECIEKNNTNSSEGE